MILSSQVREHLKTPKSTYAGSRDKDFTCDIVRVVAVSVTGHDTVKFYIAESTAAKTLDNIRSNKLINLSTTNIFTTESYQLKGRMLSVKPATEEEHQMIFGYMKLFDEMAASIGFPPGIVVNKMPYNPAMSIEFVVDLVFDQTPKIGTGKILETV
jgi:hypothetical protein